MAKRKQAMREVESYTIHGSTKVVRVGDCVLIRPLDTNTPQYVAKVESMEIDEHNNVWVKVRWYYRPEDTKGGRRSFHGAKELFLSDHMDTQSIHTIDDKCTVHSFRAYTKLSNVGPDDFFCRFDYKATSVTYLPDRVAVFCKCELPYNPDHLMVRCDACKDWFHPACVNMTTKQARKLKHFMCPDCV